MSKFSELAQILEDILGAAVKLVDGITAIKNLISSEDKPATEIKKVEVPQIEKKQVTLEEVRTVLAELSRNGNTQEVKELLRKYGAEKLSLIKPEDYEALLKDAEEIKNA